MCTESKHGTVQNSQIWSQLSLWSSWKNYLVCGFPLLTLRFYLVWPHLYRQESIAIWLPEVVQRFERTKIKHRLFKSKVRISKHANMHHSISLEPK